MCESVQVFSIPKQNRAVPTPPCFALLAKCSPSDMIVVDMITVKRKDTREANENLLRRFNRRVLQSGVIAKAKASQRFSKPQTRRDRRRVAILRDQRRAEKALQMRLGTFKASR